MKKTVCIFLLLLCFAGLFGCKSPGLLYVLNGYDAFLEEASRLPALPPNPPVPSERPPDIPGLELVTGGYDEATDYTFGYAFVRKGDQRYAVNKCGTLTQLPDSAESFSGGYYIAEKGLYYLDIHLADRCERLDVMDDIAIAAFADGYRVYVAGRLTAEASVDRGVPKFFNGLLLYDGTVCDFDLTSATLGEYMRVGLPECGRILITDGERFGYADEKGDVAIPLRFVSADSFSNGYAPVCLSDGRYAYIDPDGEILRAGEPLYFSRPPYAFHDGYGLVSEDGVSYLITRSGRQALPFELRDKRVYGRYALDDARNCRLYDVAAGEYVAEFDSVTPADGWYVCEKGGFFLTDETLEPVGGLFEHITYGDGMFRLYWGDRWWYYTRKPNEIRQRNT